MKPSLKKILRSLSLELRHILEGYYDNQGDFHPGDLETRLNALGVWRDRPAKPLEELPHLSPEDKEARKVIDAYVEYRAEAGVEQAEAVAEFVRESAYTWANRLFALRCMEARAIIDEVILQKDVYGGRSLKHNRLARKDPEACAGLDEGLFAVLFAEFDERSPELPELFNPKAPAITLRPSIQALKRCIALLSGEEAVNSNGPANDEVFSAPDALGWAYQYWNTEEKERIFEKVRAKKTKIEGSDLIPATQIYTEPYMVKFLVQNTLGALWMGMHPESELANNWKYYIKDADRTLNESRSLSEITVLDPAAGSGHFLLEAFDILSQMYEEEGKVQSEKPLPFAEEIAESILNHNLFAIDIDGRAIQIAIASLLMKAKEYAPNLHAQALNNFHDHLVSTDIHLPKNKDHIKSFLLKHPEAAPLLPALETIFEGLQNVNELGSLVKIEEPVEKELHYIKEQNDACRDKPEQMVLFEEMKKPRQRMLPLGLESYEQWKIRTLTDLAQHFTEEAELADYSQAFFNQSARKGIALFDLLSHRYWIVLANPPYLNQRNMGSQMKSYITTNYSIGGRDLYTSFIEQFRNYLIPNGQLGFVTSHTFMFLSTYYDLRKMLLTSGSVRLLVHYGTGIMKELSNPNAQGFCSWIFTPRKDLVSTFLDARNMEPNSSYNKFDSSRIFYRRTIDFLSLPNSVIAYWLPSVVIKLLKGPKIQDICTLANRTKTGENEKYVRYVWEIPDKLGKGLNWLIYQKGGEYKTFYGNNIYAIKWNESYVNYYRRDPNCRVTDLEYTCREALTYNGMGQQFAGRICPPLSTYDVQGPALVSSSNNLLLALAILNSPFGSYVIKALNGSISIQSSDVLSVPIPDLENPLVQEIIQTVQTTLELKEYLCSSDIREYSFQKVLPVDILLDKEKEFINNKNLLIDLTYRALGISDEVIDFDLPFETSIELIDIADDPNTKKELLIDYYEDIYTVLIAKLLGHRWPKQLVADMLVPEWSDSDGIIPITNAFSELTILERTRKHIPNEFSNKSVGTIERNFEEIVGEPVDIWLSSSFFKRHISQFKKRPIVWQIQSQPASRRDEPAFSCLIYYHKLDIDLLPKLRSQYVGPLRQRYETELRTLSNLALLTTDQSARRLELETWIDELKDFESRIEQVEQEGFASQTLSKIAKKESLDQWTSRDGHASYPLDRQSFELQEKRYDPDLNDGVRVNIAPLQKARLLAVDVLSKKDIDKAIADRAEWRADERRWCREGKLPHPGWWK